MARFLVGMRFQSLNPDSTRWKLQQGPLSSDQQVVANANVRPFEAPPREQRRETTCRPDPRTNSQGGSKKMNTKREIKFDTSSLVLWTTDQKQFAKI